MGKGALFARLVAPSGEVKAGSASSVTVKPGDHPFDRLAAAAKSAHLAGLG
ncbi:hypothetical protein WI560_30960 [Bradyrhizobium sp. A11]|uniref:hypothetical protein n=1 Tax=Bradyrhizobium sp. A11 TaxID=3133974 RepID=UPI00324B459A